MDNKINLVSIVIPVLNEEKLLAACLDSMKRQDYTGAFEIMVADNGSTDHTAEIARSFGAPVTEPPGKQPRSKSIAVLSGASLPVTVLTK